MTTERLRLEPFARLHAAKLLAYYERNRDHLEPWEPRRDASFYTVGNFEDTCARASDEAMREEAVRFAVFERNGADIVGIFNVCNIRRDVIQAAILGYSIDAAQQGKGFATEAGAAVVTYAFEQLRLHRVEASYQPTNERSGRVLRRLGFVVEGYARDYLNFGDGWLDHVLTARLNEAWSRVHPSTSSG